MFGTPLDGESGHVEHALRAARHGFDPALLERWARLLEQAHDSEAGTEAFAQIFVYLSEVDGGKPLYEAIEAVIDDEDRERAMGLRKEWEDAALERGIEQGIEQGTRRTLLSQLQLKFGDIGEARREQIASASLEELERWSRRILSATSLEDVLD